MVLVHTVYFTTHQFTTTTNPHSHHLTLLTLTTSHSLFSPSCTPILPIPHSHHYTLLTLTTIHTSLSQPTPPYTPHSHHSHHPHSHLHSELSSEWIHYDSVLLQLSPVHLHVSILMGQSPSGVHRLKDVLCILCYFLFNLRGGMGVASL